jgi:hypothetical protein
MPDRFGPRGVFAVLVPLQNANMQPEYERMRPDGVSNQIYRFDVSGHDRVREAVLEAVPGTLGCRPDMIVCGNSLEMRHWSPAKQRDYQHALAALAGGVPEAHRRAVADVGGILEERAGLLRLARLRDALCDLAGGQGIDRHHQRSGRADTRGVS